MERIRNLTIFTFISMSIGLSIAFGLLCWKQANQFVEVPRGAVIETPLNFGIESYDDFSVITEDGLTLHGWYIAPTRADGATFIFLHGHGGHILNMISE